MKNSKLSHHLVIGLLVAVTGAGCSVFRPVGQENFDCSGKKSTDPFCRSIRGVDRSTVGAIPDTRYDKPFDYLSYSKYHGDLDDNDANASEGKTNATAKVKSTNLLPHEIGQAGPVIQGAPVRAAPVIQKIWVNRYVDTNDKLHQPTEIFQEVVGARWVGAAQAKRATSSAAGNASSSNPYPFKPAKDASSVDGGATPAAGLEDTPTAPMPPAVIESTKDSQLSNPQ
jgi:type IV conjugative transfer system lipoprotein TraV